MTKSERLLKLIKLLKENESLHIQDMVDACGVSHRTIYRDLNSLTKLDVPLQYNNGYYLSSDPGIPFQQISADEIDLIDYALNNNPLATNPFFTEKFRTIKNALNSLKVDTHTPSIVYEKATDTIENDNKSQIMKNFLDAVQNKRNIQLRTKEAGNQLFSFKPVKVKITDDDLKFVVNQLGSGDQLTISASTIVELITEEEMVEI